jgi:hypothetical protein
LQITIKSFPFPCIFEKGIIAILPSSCVPRRLPAQAAGEQDIFENHL